MDIREIDLSTGEEIKRKMTEEEIADHNLLKQEQINRRMERDAIPSQDQHNEAAYRDRQKRKMLAGKAKVALAAGDKDTAIRHLIEAIEPSDFSDDLDGKLQMQFKKKEGDA